MAPYSASTLAYMLQQPAVSSALYARAPFIRGSSLMACLQAPARTKGRVAELERQVEEQRTTYQRRIKALEARLAAAQRRPPTNTTSSSGAAAAATGPGSRSHTAAAAAGGGSRSTAGRQSAAAAGGVTPGDTASDQHVLTHGADSAVATSSEAHGGGGGDRPEQEGGDPVQQQVSLQKLSEEVAGLRALLQERSQQVRGRQQGS
jgi:hypothetical protein